MGGAGGSSRERPGGEPQQGAPDASPAGGGGDRPSPLEEWRRRYPGRWQVAAASASLAEEILRAGAEGLLPAGGEALLLAAEVLEEGGGPSSRVDRLLEQAAAEGAPPIVQKALYRLGERAFLGGAFFDSVRTSGRERSGAWTYWSRLATSDPQGPWALRLERPLRYLRLLREKPRLLGAQPGGGAPAAPEAGAGAPEGALPAATFRDASGGEVPFTPVSLGGKVVLVLFWREESPGELEFQKVLARDTKAALLEFPELAGRVQLLGVHVGPRSEASDALLGAAEASWPQLYEERGFDGPLPAYFAIPRAPHRAVFDAEGRLAHLGAEDALAFEAFSAALRKARGL